MAVEQAHAPTQPCTHLVCLPQEVTPSGDGCQGCLRAGDAWIHLRLCLTCGHVGCCDESKNRHATRHYLATEHPVIRSFQPDEDWVWCYADKVGAPRPATSISQDVLRRLTLFSGLAEDELDRLYQMAELVVVPAGQVVMQEGEPGDALYVVIDGELEVSKQRDGAEVVLGVRGPGEFLGERALLKQAPRSATVRTRRDSRLLVVSQASFQALLACGPSVPLTIMDTVISRLEGAEGVLVQQEKMAGLGKLSAGLAHELNNPAAAVRRATAHLREALGEWERSAAALARLLADDSRLEALRARALARAGESVHLSPLARAEREEAVEVWLDDRGLERAWEVAPALVAAGWDEAALEEASAGLSNEQVRALLRWLAAATSVYGVLDEAARASAGISQIVDAVKSYAYLDQAPVQDVDVHQSLENTLVILRHKLREGIEVAREYAPDLPRIEAYGGELSQVWTNLIDNAVDAMGGQGRLTLRTRSAPDHVLVEIGDSGPGIPESAQARLFEAFYTTKPQGKGTGLGLHIAYNIVTNKHRGQITVDSRPGETWFRVRLPVQLSRV